VMLKTVPDSASSTKKSPVTFYLSYCSLQAHLLSVQSSVAMVLPSY
jgi:hypothetical protein